jgi:hypothetical protein
LREEIDTTLGLIGCPRFDQLGPDFILNEAAEPTASGSALPRPIAKAV